MKVNQLNTIEDLKNEVQDIRKSHIATLDNYLNFLDDQYKRAEEIIEKIKKI